MPRRLESINIQACPTSNYEMGQSLLVTLKEKGDTESYNLRSDGIRPYLLGKRARQPNERTVSL